MQWRSSPTWQVRAGHTASPGIAAPSVLVFIHGFGPGGVERIALRLTRGWRASGADVRLIVGRGDGPMRAELGDDARYATAAAWPLIGHRLRTLRLLVAICRAVRARRPDILFCPGNAYSAIAVMLRILLGRDCPPIVAKISNDLERRDMPPPLRRLYHVWLRMQARAIHRFAVLSEAMAAEARQRLGVSARRVHVMPNPVLAIGDLAEREPPCVAGAGRRFVAVGRLERQKDYPLMLRAFAWSSAPGDRLRIIGEGRARPALERLAADFGIAHQVTFAGFRCDVRAELRRHDVLLLSSRFEGQPGAVIEALACGMAIVATRCSTSIAPLLDGGALGTLVAVGDQAAFAAAIAACTPGAQDVARARDKARGFTIEAAVPAYLALFTRIAAAPAGHRVSAMPMKVSPT